MPHVSNYSEQGIAPETCIHTLCTCTCVEYALRLILCTCDHPQHNSNELNYIHDHSQHHSAEETGRRRNARSSYKYLILYNTFSSKIHVSCITFRVYANTCKMQDPITQENLCIYSIRTEATVCTNYFSGNLIIILLV